MANLLGSHLGNERMLEEVCFDAVAEGFARLLSVVSTRLSSCHSLDRVVSPRCLEGCGIVEDPTRPSHTGHYHLCRHVIVYTEYCHRVV